GLAISPDSKTAGDTFRGAEVMAASVRAKRASSRMRRDGARLPIRRASTSVLTRPRTTPLRPAPRPQAPLGRPPPPEWRRRMMHMTPGLLPSLFIAFPHAEPLTWYVKGPILLVTLGLAIFSLLKARLFARCGETGWVCSVVSYAVITLTLLMAFPSQPE